MFGNQQQDKFHSWVDWEALPATVDQRTMSSYATTQMSFLDSQRRYRYRYLLESHAVAFYLEVDQTRGAAWSQYPALIDVSHICFPAALDLDAFLEGDRYPQKYARRMSSRKVRTDPRGLLGRPQAA